MSAAEQLWARREEAKALDRLRSASSAVHCCDMRGSDESVSQRLHEMLSRVAVADRAIEARSVAVLTA